MSTIRLEVRQKGSQQLTLPRKDLRKNTAQLFARLAKDPAAREKFIRDPVGQISKKVTKSSLPAQAVSDANRVLFAMMANDKFRKWLDTYKSRVRGKKATQEQFGRDFAKAVLEFGDSDLVRALFKQAGDGFGFPGFSPIAQQLFTGPEKSTVTSPATPSTSDKSAHSSSNANGVLLGDSALVDPALLRAVINQLIVHAKELQATGKLSNM